MSFPDIDAVAVRVGKNEGSLAVVLILQGLDDPHAGRFADRVECVDVADEHVKHIDRRRGMRPVLAEMYLGGILLQHHEPDRIAVLEDFLKAENAGVESKGCLNVTNRQTRRHATERNGMNWVRTHRMLLRMWAEAAVRMTGQERCPNR